MVIQKRKMNKKRHSIGWKIGGKWYTRSQAVRLAKRGEVDGVRVGTKEGIEFITSMNGYPNLYDLPSVVA